MELNYSIWGQKGYHRDEVRSVCFSPDGNTLASCSSGESSYWAKEHNSIHLLDVKTGQQKNKLYGHSDYVNSICFSPDGNTLASGSDDKSIRLWDVKTGFQKRGEFVNQNGVDLGSLLKSKGSIFLASQIQQKNQ